MCPCSSSTGPGRSSVSDCSLVDAEEKRWREEGKEGERKERKKEGREGGREEEREDQEVLLNLKKKKKRFLSALKKPLYVRRQMCVLHTVRPG